MASDISKAAARDDAYDLVELSYKYRREPAKLAEIAAALEESIPRLDPVRMRSELVHVVDAAPLPELSRAREMAVRALSGAGEEDQSEGD